MPSTSAIVCVDDDEMILVALKQELLGHFGARFHYETALNADEALSIIDDLVDDGIRVILILSDWLMPGMTGDELLVRVHEKYPAIQAILITGHADMMSINQSKDKMNLKCIIHKPWNSGDLIRNVEACVG
ncbi:MAG: response regulator [Clostridia bacterium]|nr:response regulator [Clostridia bacterium]